MAAVHRRDRSARARRRPPRRCPTTDRRAGAPAAPAGRTDRGRDASRSSARIGHATAREPERDERAQPALDRRSSRPVGLRRVVLRQGREEVVARRARSSARRGGGARRARGRAARRIRRAAPSSSHSSASQCSPTASTRGRAAAPARSHASPRASAANMPAGARACVLTNTARPSASVTRYASLMSPPAIGSAATTRAPSAAPSSSCQLIEPASCVSCRRRATRAGA